MSIVVLDTETTGLNPLEDGVVELAYVYLDPCTNRVEDAESRLFNPGVPIPPEVRAVHHIRDDDIAGKRPVSEYLLETSWAGVEAFAAHNLSFDWGFIGKEMPQDIPLICTYRCSLHLYPEAPNHSNQTLRYWLGVEPQWPDGFEDTRAGSAHRALFDAYVTTAILGRMLETHSIEALAQMTKDPVLLRVCRFGKHRDTPWDKVPRDYLRWMLNNGEWDSDVLYTAKHYLGMVA